MKNIELSAECLMIDGVAFQPSSPEGAAQIVATFSDASEDSRIVRSLIRYSGQAAKAFALISQLKPAQQVAILCSDSRFVDRLAGGRQAANLVKLIGNLSQDQQAAVLATDGVVMALVFKDQAQEVLKLINSFTPKQQTAVLSAGGTVVSLSFRNLEDHAVDIIYSNLTRTQQFEVLSSKHVLQYFEASEQLCNILATFSKAQITVVFSRPNALWKICDRDKEGAALALGLIKKLSHEQQTLILSANNAVRWLCAGGQQSEVFDLIKDLDSDQQASVLSGFLAVHSLTKCRLGKNVAELIDKLSPEQRVGIYSSDRALFGLARAGVLTKSGEAAYINEIRQKALKEAVRPKRRKLTKGRTLAS